VRKSLARIEQNSAFETIALRHAGPKTEANFFTSTTGNAFLPYLPLGFCAITGRNF